MKIAAADAIAGVLSDEEVSNDYVIPSVFDRRVVKAVSEAVAHAAIEAGEVRRRHEPGSAIIAQSGE